MIPRIILFALASAITLIPTSEATLGLKHEHGGGFLAEFLGHLQKKHKEHQGKYHQQQLPQQQPAQSHVQAGFDQSPTHGAVGTVVSEQQYPVNPVVTGHVQSGPSIQHPIHGQAQAPIQHGSVQSPSHLIPQVSIQGHIQTPSYPQHQVAPSHQYPTTGQEYQPSHQVPSQPTHQIYQQGSIQQGPAIQPTHQVYVPQAPLQHTQPLQPVVTGQHNQPAYQEPVHQVQTPAPIHAETNLNANGNYKEHQQEYEIGQWSVSRNRTVQGNLRVDAEENSSNQFVPQPSGHVHQQQVAPSNPLPSTGHVQQGGGIVAQPTPCYAPCVIQGGAVIQPQAGNPHQVSGASVQTPQAGVSTQLGFSGLPSLGIGLSTQVSKHHQPPVASYQQQLNSEYPRSATGAEQNAAVLELKKAGGFPSYPMAKAQGNVLVKA